MADRVALVTGASSGIGRAVVVELCRRGLAVMAVARRAERLERLADETGAAYHAVSVASPEGCAEAVEATRRRLGPVEVLVNNAAVGSAADASVLELDPLRWREIVALDLDAPFELTRLCAPDMVAGGWGRVVTVSSISALHGEPDSAAYCASKAGLLGLTRSVAVDLARHGVTANAVLPGWVRTEMAERSAARDAAAAGITVEQVWERRAALYPSGRVVTPEEVASTVAFLASEAAGGVNGEAVTVAGGGAS